MQRTTQCYTGVKGEVVGTISNNKSKRLNKWFDSLSVKELGIPMTDIAANGRKETFAAKPTLELYFYNIKDKDRIGVERKEEILYMITDLFWGIILFVIGAIGVVKPTLIARNPRIKNMLVVRILAGVAMACGALILFLQ